MIQATADLKIDQILNYYINNNVNLILYYNY